MRTTLQEAGCVKLGDLAAAFDTLKRKVQPPAQTDVQSYAEGSSLNMLTPGYWAKEEHEIKWM